MSAEITDQELIKQKAIKQFLERLSYSKGLEKIRNEDLYAGSPMYYYCNYCGVPTEVLPEDHLFAIKSTCSQCVGLMTYNWLTEALQTSKK